MSEAQYMKREQIMETLKALSNSQGRYTALYNTLKIMEKDRPDEFEHFMTVLEDEHFRDQVDLVLYFEG